MCDVMKYSVIVDNLSVNNVFLKSLAESTNSTHIIADCFLRFIIFLLIHFLSARLGSLQNCIICFAPTNLFYSFVASLCIFSAKLNFHCEYFSFNAIDTLLSKVSLVEIFLFRVFPDCIF
jgi:hypothetical protein